MYMFMHVDMHTHVQVLMYVHTHAGAHVHALTHLQAPMYTPMHTCMHVRPHVPLLVYMLAHMSTRVQAFMYTPTRDSLAPLWVLLLHVPARQPCPPAYLVFQCWPPCPLRPSGEVWACSVVFLGGRALIASIVIKCSDMIGADTSLDHVPTTSLHPAPLPPVAKLRESSPPTSHQHPDTPPCTPTLAPTPPPPGGTSHTVRSAAHLSPAGG